MYALIRGNALGWTTYGIIGPAVAGMTLLALFIRRQQSAVAPMIDLTLFRARGFTIANIVGFLMSFGMFGSIWPLTLFMQSVQGASLLRAGLETMPGTGTIMLVAPLAGIFAGYARIGQRALRHPPACIFIGCPGHGSGLCSSLRSGHGSDNAAPAWTRVGRQN